MKLNERLVALGKALRTFEEFSRENLEENMPKAAFVKAFEYTYELSLKSMKSYTESRGLESVSPRDAIRNALKVGLIVDEPLWLSLQKDRNTTAHTYSTDYLPEMIARMKNLYVKEFQRLLDKLKEELQTEAP
ncbi:MAG: hypothetical protein FJY29_04840 [Betaproteobacteria bacterium]|nr:hypothetical protein [Betaproteobacteria bacterium]